MQLKNLKTNFLGRKVFYYEVLDSTQKEIWRRVKNNKIENGTLIFANIQTAGIGTHGRIWHTDEKNNIAFSFYLRLNCDIIALSGLTKKIAEIILQIFKDKYGINLQIKEPNDIYYNGKKLGGILSETRLIANKVKHLVIGIGINTNKEYFPEDIEGKATSIIKEFGVTVNTKEFIEEFCNRFEIEIMKRVSKS